MKRVLNSLWALFVVIQMGIAQEKFEVRIEPMTISNAPGVHSFSWGKTTKGKWVVLGGRVDGLHRRQPFAAFLEKDNNKNIYVIDPISKETWSASLAQLSAPILEQLQATNQQFHQRGKTLYIIGGYGYSKIEKNHITFDKVTAIDLDGLAKAIVEGKKMDRFFRQISNKQMAVTGGQLGLLNDVFYLAGGQYFKGRYNPMGPNHGPGFFQEYTDEIRKFQIKDDGKTLSIVQYSSRKDTENLHRRDYNMVPQIFPNRKEGFTMFSGVFQYNKNIPWLNSVDVSEKGYKVNSEFNQFLSQYHSAKVPLYDKASNAMHTLFFGGMSQYTLDKNSNLIKDDNVPFVKTISKVSRFANGTMKEERLSIEMPAYLGSGAEFIPVHQGVPMLYGDIVDLNNLKKGTTLIGYIFGGIESSKDNIFFINNGNQSGASNMLFKVYVYKK